MPDAPDSLILQYLRRIDRNVERTLEDAPSSKIRIPAVEEERLDRIERRLGLIEP